ncbi:hypothetical protein Q428_00330 [Fervidicella metallireducens AeB]|uniref:Aminoglycoside phosphotransferase domain-containing protein n=1 Tax=Fervidicella metallireducens AeB TaxID=1403537 RepID=A0A017S0S1_9CLOT|nr:CotS family spore coat protein [Fervidicella metallireducens]EYE89780.1 hypothetical protein Q428_00330 [Fervidicella metallireducens AeB]
MVRETEISTQFGFRIIEIIPMRGVYLLKTDKGDKCLKKVNYGLQKLMYLYNAKEHIIKNGFKNIDMYLLTPTGVPYALVNDDVYVVTEWIDGRECDFRDEEDLKQASKLLGEFHLLARGFIPDESVRMRNDIGKLEKTLEKRLSTLNKMRDMARKNKRKTDFDIMYLSNVDFYIKLGQQALNTLDIEAYNRVCQAALEDNVLCHHDYTYHNIIMGNDGQNYIVDFDYCKAEIQIYDVSTLMVKSLKRLEWNPETAKAILEAYSQVKPITSDELNILKTLLVFPQRFWRLANRYYYKESRWNTDTFSKKMSEIINEREQYMNFIENIDSILY